MWDDDNDPVLLKALEESLRHYNEVEKVRLSQSEEAPQALPSTSRQNCASTSNIEEFYDGQEAHGFNLSAGQEWTYPTNYPIRLYQKSIVEKALFNNTLVSLPTGLGKTFIAAVVMYNYYNWYPKGKVIFMAPTKPLVAQQIDNCYNITGIPREHTAEMTGLMNAKERAVLWNEKRVFFLTPQVVQNDLCSGICPAQLVKCVVIDEAHKATGDHAYVQVIRLLNSFGAIYRVLALSATPGSDMEAVQKVVSNLMINHIELRSEQSPDVLQYTHERTVEIMTVPIGPTLSRIREKYIRIIQDYARRLQQNKVLFGNVANLTKFALLKAKEEFARTRNTMQPILYNNLSSDFAVITSLAHGLELLQTYGLRLLLNHLQGLLNGEKGNDAVLNRIVNNEDIKNLILEIEGILNDCQGGGQGQSNEGKNTIAYGHPKLDRLQEVIVSHFEDYSEKKVPTKVIVFCEYRDGVVEITEMLKHFEPLVKPVSFMGQASGKSAKGLPQKMQLKVMEQFRNGYYNTLVSTCVGEEGLDIGEVDLIICFDAKNSPIRQVQRMGRTGRKRKGRIIMLITQGKEEAKYKHSLLKKNNVNIMLVRKESLTGYLLESVPPMIPPGISPKCVERFIKITESKPRSNQQDLRKMFLKRGSKTGSNEHTAVRSCYLSEEDMQELIQEGFTNESIKFDRIPPSSEYWFEIPDNSHSDKEVDLSFYLEHLRLDQRTHLVDNSSRSEMLRDLLLLSENKAMDIDNNISWPSQVSATQIWPGKRKPQNKEKNSKKRKLTSNVKKTVADSGSGNKISSKEQTKAKTSRFIDEEDEDEGGSKSPTLFRFFKLSKTDRKISKSPVHDEGDVIALDDNGDDGLDASTTSDSVALSPIKRVLLDSLNEALKTEKERLNSYDTDYICDELIPCKSISMLLEKPQSTDKELKSWKTLLEEVSVLKSLLTKSLISKHEEENLVNDHKHAPLAPERDLKMQNENRIACAEIGDDSFKIPDNVEFSQSKDCWDIKEEINENEENVYKQNEQHLLNNTFLKNSPLLEKPSNLLDKSISPVLGSQVVKRRRRTSQNSARKKLTSIFPLSSQTVESSHHQEPETKGAVLIQKDVISDKKSVEDKELERPVAKAEVLSPTVPDLGIWDDFDNDVDLKDEKIISPESLNSVQKAVLNLDCFGKEKRDSLSQTVKEIKENSNNWKGFTQVFDLIDNKCSPPDKVETCFDSDSAEPKSQNELETARYENFDITFSDGSHDDLFAHLDDGVPTSIDNCAESKVEDKLETDYKVEDKLEIDDKVEDKLETDDKVEPVIDSKSENRTTKTSPKLREPIERNVDPCTSNFKKQSKLSLMQKHVNKSTTTEEVNKTTTLTTTKKCSDLGNVDFSLFDDEFEESWMFCSQDGDSKNKVKSDKDKCSLDCDMDDKKLLKDKSPGAVCEESVKNNTQVLFKCPSIDKDALLADDFEEAFKKLDYSIHANAPKTASEDRKIVTKPEKTNGGLPLNEGKVSGSIRLKEVQCFKISSSSSDSDDFVSFPKKPVSPKSTPVRVNKKKTSDYFPVTNDNGWLCAKKKPEKSVDNPKFKFKKTQECEIEDQIDLSTFLDDSLLPFVVDIEEQRRAYEELSSQARAQKPVVKSDQPKLKKRKEKKKKKKKKTARCAFVDSEAEESNNDAHSSSDGESTSLDELDSSFINDSNETQTFASVDIQAKYLQSVKSPIVSGGRFKMRNQLQKPVDMNVFSQIPVQDSTYMNDSFCVGEDASDISAGSANEISVLELAERQLKAQRKEKKRLKKGSRKRLEDTKKRKAESESTDSNDEEKSLTKPKSRLKRKAILDSESEEECNRGVTEKGRSEVPKQPKNAEFANLLDDDDFSLSLDLDAFNDKKEQGASSSVSVKCLSASKETNHYGNFSKKVPVIFNRPPNNPLQTHSASRTSVKPATVTSNYYQVNSSTSKTEVNKGPVLVIASSKQVACAPEIIRVIRVTHGVTIVPRSVSYADFLVSWRIGLVRISMSDLRDKVKLEPLVSLLKQYFIKPVLIIEKDRIKGVLATISSRKQVKPKLKEKSSSGPLWNSVTSTTVALLRQSGITLLFPRDKDDTAGLIYKLALKEKERGHSLSSILTNIPETMEKKLNCRLQFLCAIPGVNVALALKLLEEYKSLQCILNKCSSVCEISTTFRLVKAEAQKVHAVLNEVQCL